MCVDRMWQQIENGGNGGKESFKDPPLSAILSAFMVKFPLMCRVLVCIHTCATCNKQQLQGPLSERF